MARRTVTTPRNEQWQVRRLWAPRLQGETLWARFRRRLRRVRRRSDDVGDVAGCGLDLVDDLVVVAAVVAVGLFVVFFAVPLLIAVLDVLVIVLLTVLGVAARVLLRRPWTVEATGPDGLRRTWRVVGWRNAGELVDEVANDLAHGHPPPAGHTVWARRGRAGRDG